MGYVIDLILLAIVFNAIVLDKALHLLSLKELKRRARSGRDKKAGAIYKMASYGPSLFTLLWLKGAAAAAILLIISANKSWWLALIVVAVLAWALKVWQVHSTSGWVWAYTAAVSPLAAWVMGYLQPVLQRVNMGKFSAAPHHNAIYEKEDLLEFLKAQNSHPENRIPEEELKIAFNALCFGEKTVGQVMTPLRQVRVVTEGEQVGPLLMDELHKTGFSRFPVTKDGDKRSANSRIVGTLYLKDLLGYEGNAKVRDLMREKVAYVNETQNLGPALAAFLKTHNHLAVVVNSFEELVGVLSLEDVLEQILGQQIVDEFDQYDDLRAVAGHVASKEHSQHAPSKVE